MDYFLLFIFLVLIYEFITRDKNTLDLPTTPTVDIDLFIFKENKRNYLKSPQWHLTRKKILRRDKYTCQSCTKSGLELHVHHLSDYARLGKERHSKLITLCGDCHTAWHQKYGYPITYEDYINWNFSLKTVKHLDKPI